MPIITPAYPSMCATHNVTDSTRDIMLHEFRRTGEIADKIMIGTGKWKDLFEESDFFQIYNHYLQIVASSFSSQSQLQWSGLVESRLRQLVSKLELVDLLKIAHPYIKGIEKVHYCFPGKESWDAAHGNFSIPDRTFTVDSSISELDHIRSISFLSPEEKESLRPIYTTTFYIGLKVEPITDESPGPRKLNLVWPTSEFMKSAKMWDKYDQKTMGITVKNLKGSMLPDELGGESRRLKRLQANKMLQQQQSSTRTSPVPPLDSSTNIVNSK
jgi:poly(A) polymerase